MLKSSFLLFLLWIAQAVNPAIDNERSVAFPTLTQNAQGQVVAYWAEKDDSNTYLYFATSTDSGQTFGGKQLIYANAGIGIGRLAKPKLLFKKDGTMVAVFSYREGGMPPRRPEGERPRPEGNHGGGSHEPPKPAEPSTPPTPRPKRSSEIRYTESKDGGKTWSEPKSVDSDTTPLVRGFFDAVVLPNDEIAISYLKDVKNSKKREERDLRMVITKNGEFQEEKLIDAVVCDCCSTNLLVDADGNLNVFYRDNNDDIRDIARLVSKDNGVTFEESEILHDDNWEIQGCPHQGATSVANNNGAFITWFSGATESPGVRLVDETGSLIKVLDPTATNAAVAADDQAAAFVWQQNGDEISTIYWGKVVNGKLSEVKEITGSENGQNPSAVVVNGKTIVAYEVARPDEKAEMKIQVVD